MKEATLNTPPTYPTDLLHYFQWLVGQLNSAMAVRNFEDAVIYASAAVDHMSHQQFVVFNDIRAYAYAKQGLSTRNPFLLFEMVPGLFHSASKLRRIDLDLGTTAPVFTIVDILEACNNLTELALSSAVTINSIAGNFSRRSRPYQLSKLQLTFSNISAQYVRNFLCSCPHLRRLAINVIPLLYKNMGTLKVLRMDMPLFSGSQALHVSYPQFNLSNLDKLSITLTSDTQSFMLDAIRNASNLESFFVVNPPDTNLLVNTILTRSPRFPLRKFGITYEQSYHEATAASNLHQPNNCVQLLTYYAQTCRNLLSSTSPPLLKSVCFRRYPGVTDATLAALTKIETLQHVEFQYLTNVSPSGIYSFITSSVVGNGLSMIDLVGLDQITSKIAGSLGLLNNVKRHVIPGFRFLKEPVKK
ncbi:hypothetical protein BDB00DRAFT_935199 [Zychaea mexicana]|uniref:uncharacterized protein n=1 Tax=Zychaea mexicana TaxID=64656 RepID=UPI0022FE44BA|nr:uncharacterized protein BDB00DRAFT_935199 [Zychaea mexicana]KAI9498942.1 hypothetical protein BDB00DRAFT_935199 [Zychaea mexicana]